MHSPSIQVSELAEEVGLSREAARHMIRVAGPRRYDPSSGDLVLVSRRYNSREENRWGQSRAGAGKG
jgi:hypothetical protein